MLRLMSTTSPMTSFGWTLSTLMARGERCRITLIMPGNPPVLKTVLDPGCYAKQVTWGAKCSGAAECHPLLWRCWLSSSMSHLPGHSDGKRGCLDRIVSITHSEAFRLPSLPCQALSMH